MPATSSAATVLFDDAELRDVVEAFAPEIEGFDVPSPGRERAMKASSAFGRYTSVVEPAACNSLERAVTLGTDQDLLGAAGDMVRYVGYYVPGGILPEGPPFAPDIGIVTRVFADEALAASLYATLLDADCATYTMTEDQGTHDRVLEQTVDQVATVQLDGLDRPTVRVAYAKGHAYGVTSGGEIEEGDVRDAWSEYVHVDGPYAIIVELCEVDDEETVAAQIIADYLAHMDGA